MVSRKETSYSTFALSFTFVTMDVRGSRDLEGAQVAMDADPRCVHALGMDKRLGSPDLEGLRLAMDADPRGTLAIGVDCFLLSPSRKSRGGGTPKPIGAQKHSQSCCFIDRNCCFSTNPVLSPLWEPPPHSPWGRNVGIAPQSPCSHGIWCSNRMRARALGELRPPDPHVLVRLAVKRRPRGRGDSLGFRRLRRRNPHVPPPNGVARGAEPRPVPG